MTEHAAFAGVQGEGYSDGKARGVEEDAPRGPSDDLFLNFPFRVINLHA